MIRSTRLLEITGLKPQRTTGVVTMSATIDNQRGERVWKDRTLIFCGCEISRALGRNPGSLARRGCDEGEAGKAGSFASLCRVRN